MRYRERTQRQRHSGSLPLIPQLNRGFDKRVAVRLRPASVVAIAQKVILLIGTDEIGLQRLLPIPVKGVYHAVLVAGRELLVWQVEEQAFNVV